MGGAFSASSICRFVGGVEIVTSSVILGFGIQSLVCFQNMDEGFQEKFPVVQYSSAGAIVYGALTILTSLVLIVGSNLNTPLLKGEGTVNSHRRSKGATVFKSWLVFSVLSIVLLGFIVFAPIGYCLRTPREEETALQETPAAASSSPGKSSRIPCTTSNKEVLTLREALKDLYSYCIVNMIVLFFFLILVYFQLKRNLRKQRSDKEAVLSNGMMDEGDEATSPEEFK